MEQDRSRPGEVRIHFGGTSRKCLQQKTKEFPTTQVLSTHLQQYYPSPIICCNPPPIEPPPFASEEEGANECSFRLTGAANKSGDWSRMENISFEVSVTWIVVAEEEEEILEEEETIPGNEEAGVPQKQEALQPVSEPGEDIVRKIIPVVTDSNVALDEEKDGISATEKSSGNQGEKEGSDAEKKSEKQKEGAATMDESEPKDTKEMKDEKDVSP